MESLVQSANLNTHSQGIFTLINVQMYNISFKVYIFLEVDVCILPVRSANMNFAMDATNRLKWAPSVVYPITVLN